MHPACDPVQPGLQPCAPSLPPCAPKASYMLSHGAELVVTAEDAFNPSVDPDYPQSVFPLPGECSSKLVRSKLLSRK